MSKRIDLVRDVLKILRTLENEARRIRAWHKVHVQSAQDAAMNIEIGRLFPTDFSAVLPMEKVVFDLLEWVVDTIEECNREVCGSVDELLNSDELPQIFRLATFPISPQNREKIARAALRTLCAALVLKRVPVMDDDKKPCGSGYVTYRTWNMNRSK